MFGISFSTLRSFSMLFLETPVTLFITRNGYRYIYNKVSWIHFLKGNGDMFFMVVSIFAIARRNTAKTSVKRLQLDWSNDFVTLHLHELD
jgi:hypothetical protein